MKKVQTFPDGPVLFEHCSKFGFEGVVSKRLISRYSSGPSRHWQKVKCPDWKRINAERWRIFEGPTKPELTEAQKTLAKKQCGACQGAGAASRSRRASRHGARIAQANGHPGAGNRRIGAGLICALLSQFQPGHPRACGGNPTRSSQKDSEPGPSPPMRGRLASIGFNAGFLRAIPAHAGETPKMSRGST